MPDGAFAPDAFLADDTEMLYGVPFPGVAQDPQYTDESAREEFVSWKANAGMIYDMALSTNLLWPSLTVKWLPDAAERDGKVTHKILFGTHTSGGEQNYLCVGDLTINENCDVQPSEAVSFRMSKCINHPGDVNLCAYSPCNPAFVATATETGDVLVFDLSQHPADAAADGSTRAQATLSGAGMESYSVEWCSQTNWLVASGADDGVLRVWDASAAASGSKKMSPLHSLSGHDDAVEDLSWSNFHPKVIASCGDDKSLFLWDLNQGLAPVQKVASAHEAEIHSVAFSPAVQHVIATGAKDGTVNIWDSRKLQTPYHTIKGHKSAVDRVVWHPTMENWLATGSDDCRVLIWNLNEIGAPQSEEDKEDGPPELAFMHCGHTQGVHEVAWGLDGKMTLVSVSSENVLQAWRPRADALGLDDSDLDDDDDDDKELFD
jgi:histone-binding protein RBBP4